MKEAMHYIKKEKKIVQCQLCPRQCVISPDQSGVCKARKNINGKLYSLVFARPIATNIDPIEKKPLFHFYPGSQIFSIGTVGCNLMCQHCQNWQIARGTPDMTTETVSPEKIVELAVENDCSMIAYTYTEPTIFYEYVLETAKIAHQHGLKNVIVSNGYINPKPLKELMPYLDAANIDLKGFSEEFYKKVCFATLAPVLETIKT
ncbi:MAG: AmmeMemoRadiSam system radical SAM enzyme, partial [Nanoarchaeota archaeon]|nr:AmmeMemoRadiSam system radical SAM enzyme [Nanoarchaeota archaeon]